MVRLNDRLYMTIVVLNLLTGTLNYKQNKNKALKGTQTLNSCVCHVTCFLQFLNIDALG